MAERKRFYGERITQARQLRTMSCAELATQMGVSTREMICLEAECDAPTPEQRASLCFLLGVPPAYFSKPIVNFLREPMFFCKTTDFGPTDEEVAAWQAEDDARYQAHVDATVKRNRKGKR